MPIGPTRRLSCVAGIIRVGVAVPTARVAIDYRANQDQKKGNYQANCENCGEHGYRLELLVAGATAATTSTASAGGRSGSFGRTASHGGAENRKLNRVLLARALGARDFLLFVDDDFLEVRFAVVADVFVDWHV